MPSIIGGACEIRLADGEEILDAKLFGGVVPDGGLGHNDWQDKGLYTRLRSRLQDRRPEDFDGAWPIEFLAVPGEHERCDPFVGKVEYCILCLPVNAQCDRIFKPFGHELLVEYGGDALLCRCKLEPRPGETSGDSKRVVIRLNGERQIIKEFAQ